VGAGRGHSEFFVHDLAICKGQSPTDFTNCCLHVKGLAGEGGVGIVLGNIERNPFATLLGIESEYSQSSCEVGPGCQGTGVNRAYFSTITMKSSRITIFENNMADIGVEIILHFLLNFFTFDFEDVL